MPDLPALDILSIASLGVAAVVLAWLLWALRRAGALRADLAQARTDLARLEERASAAEQREADTAAYRAQIEERARRTHDELRTALDAERREVAQRDTRIGELKTTLEKEREAGEEQLKLLRSVREDMEARFKALADQSVRTQGETLSRLSQERLEALLKPLRDNVGKFEVELRSAHQGAAKERERLKAEIAQLSAQSQAISEQAVNLTRALKGDTRQQGAWGEMILTGLLERSGLREGEEYFTQSHATDEDGRRYRPDVVVRLPGSKNLVIDSKVSLIAYERAVNAEIDEARALALRQHLTAMKAHIDGLSSKAYHRVAGETVDYVVMFLPIEGALSEALRAQGDLTGYALERNVTIATPTTLMMALRTIENVWAVERRSRNAEEIADRAGRLYDKVAGFVDAMQDVGTRLDQASKAHSTAMNRLSTGSGNVIRQVEQLRELGAKSSKTIALHGEEGDAIADQGATDPPTGEDDAQ
ncbi:DNA recombination protein RmuC [Sediminimonas sp.]|uniref:DNA recombination protein RmuC n=1 Tax=Sediminimonas sp. TaxID=2823379 RepID=UPI0025D14BB0|nr:DNA recombination protein RmuC [Sediminimonas sp.]